MELFFTRAHEITHGFVLVRTFGLSYRTRWFGNRGGRGRWPQAARGRPGVYVTQFTSMLRPWRGLRPTWLCASLFGWSKPGSQSMTAQAGAQFTHCILNTFAMWIPLNYTQFLGLRSTGARAAKRKAVGLLLNLFC